MIHHQCKCPETGAVFVYMGFLFSVDLCNKLHMTARSDLMNHKLYLVPIHQQQLVIFTWIRTKLVQVSRWLPHTRERRAGPSTITII